MMIYQTGTYTDMHDLLGTIKSFLDTNGWTINKWELDEQGYKDWTGLDYTGAMRLHIKKQAADGTWMYFNLKSVKRGLIFGHYYDSIGEQINGRYYSEIRGIGINGSTGYDAGEKWDEQPGYPVNFETTASIGACITEVPIASSYNYYIFHYTDSCVVVVQIDDNRFMYLAFGLLTKSGVYTGGQFYSASREVFYPSYNYWYLSSGRRNVFRAAFLANSVYHWNASTLAVYLEIDDSNAWRHNGKGGYNDYYGEDHKLQTGVRIPYSLIDDVTWLSQHAINFNEFIYERSPNHYNGVAILAPAYIFAKRATERYTYLGCPEGVRVLNRSIYTSGQEFSIGDDTWKVFPAFDIADEDSTIINLSPHIGFAFLKATS